MRGHVPTPDAVAEKMVTELFDGSSPVSDARILFPGVGDGPFVSAVERYCMERGDSMPEGVAIDTDEELLDTARDRIDATSIEFRVSDFLDVEPSDIGEFDYIVGNPPYVPIEDLEEGEKRTYRDRFETATGRFDLYILFFEQSLRLLGEGGRLVFVTPEKFEYVETATPLRELLAEHHVERIEHLEEGAFDGYVTYPTITTVAASGEGATRIERRDGSTDTVSLPDDGRSWAPYVRQTPAETPESGVTLGDICRRISCGLATGRDGLFVQSREEVPGQLLDEGWTYPTVSGRQLEASDGPEGPDVIICPYDDRGNLIPEPELGAFGDWAEIHRDELEQRSCVEKGKPWYAWHETPPMEDVVGRRKILFRDITADPTFWLDEDGAVLPRHSVYYAVPRDGVDCDGLLEYLNSERVTAWLESNCQKAHNDYLRLQSNVLERLPVPEQFGDTIQQTLV